MRKQRLRYTNSFDNSEENLAVQRYEEMPINVTSEEWPFLQGSDLVSSFYFPYLYPDQGILYFYPQYNFLFQDLFNNYILQDNFNGVISNQIRILSDNYWNQFVQPYQYQDMLLMPIIPVVDESQCYFSDENEYSDVDSEISIEPKLTGYLQVSEKNPVITPYGTIAIILRHCIRVDITLDKAIYLTNFPGGCVAVLNGAGDKSCIMHPSGKIFQDGLNGHIATGNRLAKITRRGITFTSLNRGLAFLVDESGTKSTTEKFMELRDDLPFDIFYSNAYYGPQAYEDCIIAVANAVYRNFENGDELWDFGGIRIKQGKWGDVQVSRNFGRKVLRTSPTIRSISVSTPLINMVVGCDPNRYFYVRRGKKRISANINGFTVRNGTQASGFNRSGTLVLY